MFGNYVTVYTTSGAFEADSIIAFLKSMGISAIKSQESSGIAYGFTIGPFAKVEILVPAAEADHALDVLARMDKGEYELKDNEDLDEPDHNYDND